MSKVKYLGDKLSILLKSTREYTGLGLRELSKELEISPATLSRIENGKEPDIKSLFIVCHYLKQPMHSFFEIKHN